MPSSTHPAPLSGAEASPQSPARGCLGCPGAAAQTKGGKAKIRNTLSRSQPVRARFSLLAATLNRIPGAPTGRSLLSLPVIKKRPAGSSTPGGLFYFMLLYFFSIFSFSGFFFSLFLAGFAGLGAGAGRPTEPPRPVGSPRPRHFPARSIVFWGLFRSFSEPRRRPGAPLPVECRKA